MNETNATVDFLICLPFSLHVPTPRVHGVGVDVGECHVCWVSLLCCHVPCFRFPRLIDRGTVPIPKSTKFEPVKNEFIG
jgi:hypothetical protein